MAAFCRDEGVSGTSFYAWRGRLAEAGREQAPAIEFVELPSVAASTAAPIVVELGDVVLRLGRGVDATDLRTVLAALEGRR